MSNREIAKKYIVGESSIRKWKKSIDLLLDYSRDKLTLHGGQVSSGLHLEPALCQWIDELRNDSCDVTVELAVLCALLRCSEFVESSNSSLTWHDLFSYCSLK